MDDCYFLDDAHTINDPHLVARHIVWRWARDGDLTADRFLSMFPTAAWFGVDEGEIRRPFLDTATGATWLRRMIEP